MDLPRGHLDGCTLSTSLNLTARGQELRRTHHAIRRDLDFNVRAEWRIVKGEKVFGSVGRLGYLAPATAETTLHELYSYLPEGVGVSIAGMRINRVTRATVGQEAQTMVGRARDLAASGVDLIAIAGAPVIYWAGVGSDDVLAAEVTDEVGVPAFCDPTAVRLALESMGVQRLGIVSPFDAEINTPMERYFSDSGFSVVTVIGDSYTTNADLRRVSPMVPYKKAASLVRGGRDLDAVFFYCASWATMPALLAFERDFGIVATSQIQAISWMALRHFGFGQRIDAMGRLLSSERSLTPV
jgi:maleate cis-trans isomerase